MEAYGRWSDQLGLPPAGRIASGMAVAGRRAIVGTYVALALIGAAVGPPVSMLVWGPVVALSVAAAVWVVSPGARRAAGVGAVAGGLAPAFGHGLGLLGSAAAVVLVGMLATGALLLVAWGAEVPAEGPRAERRRLLYLRWVLPKLPVEALVREWQLSDAAVTDDADPGSRAAAAELRAMLLDELDRRDPDEVGRWLRRGDPGDPDPGDARTTS